VIKKVVVFFSFIFATLVLTSAKASEKLDILVIHSYHHEYSWTSTQYEGFRKQLINNLHEYPLNFSTEYLNTKRITPSETYKKYFIRYIREKYKNNAPDLVYVTDDNALDFIYSKTGRLPWDVPIVFSGINNTALNLKLNERIIAGVFEYKDIKNSIFLAKKISPDLARIIFIGDGGVTDKAIKGAINKNGNKNSKLELVFLSSHTLDGVITKLNAVGDGVVILTTVGGLKDNDGKLLGLNKILHSIINTGRKILVLEDTYIYPGILGGYVTSGSIQGKSAANIASHLLRGGLVSKLDLSSQAISEFVISWVDMKRFNIHLSNDELAKAKVINEPIPLTERYPNLITWLFSFLAVLIIIMVASLLRIVQRNHLVKEQYTDMLTHLPNRVRLLHDTLKVSNPHLAIIDVNNFRAINNLYGLEVGDELLKSLGRRLLNLLGNQYKLYRVGGNQFGLMNETYISDKQFDEQFLMLLKEVQHSSFNLGELDINLLLTVGVSRNETEFIIPRAEQALQHAKDSNQDYFIIDDANDDSEKYEDNLFWAKKLDLALKNDRLVPYFQLITDNRTGEKLKYEALVRLLDGDKVVTPFFFLDAAKARRQYAALTKIMIEKTFSVLVENDVSISINFSVDDIRDDKTIAFFKQKLAEYPVANKVIIELTESEGIDNYSEVSEFISTIKKLGCRVAIDDFGTGYSNFMHLVHLDVDYLKIDGSIIRAIVEDKNSEIVTRAIVDFARQLGIETIAEYVETQEIQDKVVELGIDYSQGYLLGKPERFLSNS